MPISLCWFPYPHVDMYIFPQPRHATLTFFFSLTCGLTVHILGLGNPAARFGCCNWYHIYLFAWKCGIMMSSLYCKPFSKNLHLNLRLLFLVIWCECKHHLSLIFHLSVSFDKWLKSYRSVASLAMFSWKKQIQGCLQCSSI